MVSSQLGNQWGAINWVNWWFNGYGKKKKTKKQKGRLGVGKRKKIVGRRHGRWRGKGDGGVGDEEAEPMRDRESEHVSRDSYVAVFGGGSKISLCFRF